MPDAIEYVRALVSVFVIVNPIGMASMFLSLTPGHTDAERNRIAIRSSLAVMALLGGAALVGRAVLRLFGIGVPSFRVGGGILLLLIAVDMLNARPSRSRTTPEEDAEAGEREDIAVVPLAIPLLAGPGAISTVILYAQGQAGIGVGAVVSIGVLIGAACWVVLRLASPIGRRLGKTGINTLSRLMGLILAATAIEFIAAGIRELLPALAVGAR